MFGLPALDLGNTRFHVSFLSSLAGTYGWNMRSAKLRQSTPKKAALKAAKPEVAEEETYSANQLI